MMHRSMMNLFLALAFIGPPAWAGDLPRQQTVSMAQSERVPVQVAATVNIEKNAPDANAPADDRRTHRTRLLIIFLKLFDGQRGAIP